MEITFSLVLTEEGEGEHIEVLELMHQLALAMGHGSRSKQKINTINMSRFVASARIVDVCTEI